MISRRRTRVSRQKLASDPDAFVTKIAETGSAPAISPPVSPNSGTQGQTIPNFTVNGSNFDPAAVLSFSGTGITVNSYTSRTAMQIVGGITIASTAATGSYDVTITNPDSQHVTLTGGFTVIGQPAISVSPSQITFPPTPINTRSAPVTVTITNSGTVGLLISDISTQTPFAIINPSSNIGASIPPGGTASFDMIFTPTVAGPFSGSVTILSNAPTSPTVIPLQGTVILPPPPELPDLSITSVRPVQVVFDADIDGDHETDLVLKKPAGVLVTVHVINAVALKVATTVQLQFQQVAYRKVFQPSELTNSGDIQLTFKMVPVHLGTHQLLTAIVDPDNAVLETDETNNSFDPIMLSIRQTRSLVIHYVKITRISRCLLPLSPCYRPLDETAAATAFTQSKDFIRGTYPVQTIDGAVVGNFEGNAIPLAGMKADVDRAWTIAMQATPTPDRVVVLVPTGYFLYHTLNVAGYSFKNKKAVLVEVSCWSCAAHEVGHTYGLHTPKSWGGPGEEYQTNPPGNCATGYWVDRDVPVTQGLCFMGSVPSTAIQTFTFPRECATGPLAIRHVWIDPVDYKFLFNTLSQ